MHIHASVDISRAPDIIEDVCASDGLQISMKSTLSKYPGSVHWHFKRPNERGTLEITLIEKERRVFLAMQAGRSARWVEKCMPRLKEKLEQRFEMRSRK